MLPDIREYSRLHIRDVIEKLDMKNDISQVLNDDNSTNNLFDDEVSDDTDLKKMKKKHLESKKRLTNKTTILWN